MDIVLKNNFLNVTVNSHGAELKSIKQGETEYIWQADPDVWNSSAPLLFPICGRLKDNSYTLDGKKYALNPHGFARHLDYKTEKLTGTEVLLSAEYTVETLKVYPFKFKFFVGFTLIDKKLNITYTVENISDNALYFSFGGHEGYSCPEGAEHYSVSFPSDNVLKRHMLNGGFFNGKTEEIVLENGELPLNYDEFEKCTYIFKKLNSTCVILHNENNSRSVKVSFDSDIKTLALWTLRDRKYLCIEPWWGTSQDEDFNGDFREKDGVILLDAGKTFSRSHSIEIL